MSRHTGIKERCCSLKSFNGFSVRVDTQSDFAGAPVVGDSPPWKTRALIVGGNLSADRVQVSCIDGLERLCDTTVEEVPVRRTQGSVSLLSELIVAKVVGLSCSPVLFTHNAPLPQFIQRLYHRIFALLAGSRKHDERKLTPDDCSHVCHLMGQWGELREPCREHGLHRWRKRRGWLREEREWIAGNSLCSFALFQCPCPRHLDHEQRVAFCLVIEHVDRGWIELVAHDMLSQGCRLNRIERPERDFCHQAISLQCAQERYQGMSG